jgi:hypothetical protein
VSTTSIKEKPIHKNESSYDYSYPSDGKRRNRRSTNMLQRSLVPRL